jgi:hypothetical protein
MFHGKPSLALLASTLVGCVSMQGPCSLETDAAGGMTSLQCDASGSATILAPSRAIEATRATSEASP